ncbi:sensor histidine kinase [Algibacter sp. PT7-4]|uniref:sensor histidine kinase n=1 Tax=Algibacter ulvanivorans TaxID=3400999 RepID=UPI003AAD01F8
MIQFLKTYKAFVFGYVVIVPIFYILDYFGFILLPEEQSYEIFIYGLFWGTLIALPIHFYKQKKKTIISILGLMALFFIALIIDSKMSLPDNPITFILMLGFWLGFVYMLVPTFFKKYWRLIVFIYGTLLLYFLYLRLFTGGLDAYLKIKADFPLYIFFIPIPVLFMLWIFEQWKWVQKLKADKSEAELSLLRSQINPHFFFNTLNNLYALSIKKSDAAPEVILKLSDMMRYTIYEGEKEQVALQDEITYLNNYIQLHKIRYKKSVDIRFNHNIDTCLTVAPLLFIILLENAFKHGVETLSENAYIHINLYDDKNHICFDIENNFDEKEIASSKGIGLENLKRRLSLLYKNQHDFTVEKSANTYKATLKISKHA